MATPHRDPATRTTSSAVRIELSIDTADGAIAADSLGVPRIELCSAGALGGLTPGPGLLASVLSRVRQAEVHVLVRPREGGFRYSPAEVNAMSGDVAHAVEAGAAGVVIGALDAAGDPDRAVLADLVATAQGRAVTFHRAIDVCRDPVAAIDQLAELGFTRVLSSGQAARAEAGIPVLTRLVRAARGRLAVMACGGIRPGNALAVIRATGVRDLHAAPRRVTCTPHHGRSVTAGRSFAVDFGGHSELDLAVAAELLEVVR
ncbi:MAG TPA: copper homeostasis protein CutC [Amycolatopsis sp.]|nr:copper homeostasis protein CutC [Amycolatopsis sp.]